MLEHLLDNWLITLALVLMIPFFRYVFFPIVFKLWHEFYVLTLRDTARYDAANVVKRLEDRFVNFANEQYHVRQDLNKQLSNAREEIERLKFPAAYERAGESATFKFKLPEGLTVSDAPSCRCVMAELKPKKKRTRKVRSKKRRR